MNVPPAEQVQSYLSGAWRLMTGRADGMRHFDLSADGFWESFHAITVALPPLIAGWVVVANRVGSESFAERVSALLRLAFIDMVAWLLPLAVLAVVARPLRIGNRYVPYVVASNWGAALIIWLMAPFSVANLFWPAGSGVVDALSLAAFVATLVLSWRLTNAALALGPAVASGVFAAMFAGSLAIVISLQSLLGVVPS